MWISRKKYDELSGRIAKLEEGTTALLDACTKIASAQLTQKALVDAGLRTLGKTLSGQWWRAEPCTCGCKPALELVRVSRICPGLDGAFIVEGSQRMVSASGYANLTARIPVAEFGAKWVPTTLTDDEATSELAKALRELGAGFAADAKSLEPEAKKEEKPTKKK